MGAERCCTPQKLAYRRKSSVICPGAPDMAHLLHVRPKQQQTRRQDSGKATKTTRLRTTRCPTLALSQPRNAHGSRRRCRSVQRVCGQTSKERQYDCEALCPTTIRTVPCTDTVVLSHRCSHSERGLATRGSAPTGFVQGVGHPRTVQEEKSIGSTTGKVEAGTSNNNTNVATLVCFVSKLKWSQIRARSRNGISWKG